MQTDRRWIVPSYAEYVSCNAPEAGALNTHADPVCICACYADRLIAMQPKPQINHYCGAQKDPAHPTYHECNCTATGGVHELNGSNSLRYVGAMQVQCPYFYYSEPQSQYGHQTACGVWLSYPRAGACPHHDDGQALTVDDFRAGGCTWSPRNMARNIYGSGACP